MIDENAVKKMQQMISGYEELLTIIRDHAGEDGICRLNKREITELYGISYTGALKKLKFLTEHGHIEKVEGGHMYFQKSFLESSPIPLMVKVIELTLHQPDLYSSHKKQAEMLGVSYRDIQVAWGYFIHFFGKKYPTNEMLDALNDTKT